MDGSATESSRSASAEQGLFLAAFLGLFGLFNAAVWVAHEAVFPRLTGLTSRLSSILASALGLATAWGTDFVVVQGYRLTVNAECTALVFLMMYVAGVLSHPRHAPGYKLRGAVLGGLFLVFVNVVRIVSLGVIGAHFPRAILDAAHSYLWQGGFVVMLVLTWTVWTRRELFSRRHVRIGVAATLAAIVGVFAIGLLMKPYVQVLAGIANRLVAGVGGNLTIAAVNHEVAYGALGHWDTFAISADVFDAVIYFVLIAASAAASDPGTRVVHAFLLGCAALFLLHLSFVLVMWGALSSRLSADQSDALLWFMRVVSLAAPLALWGLARKGLALRRPV